MAEPPSALRASLAGRYDVERELGVGGMATVYLAHDVRHGRKVAVKVMRPEVASTIGTERFLAEIRTTAVLQHPHILGLIDSGAFEGDGDSRPFYVMPFLPGETLRARLLRDGSLSINDTLTILIEVADALACAHDQGFVHRDIKPDNILFNQGHAMVTDFGIAKAVHRSADDASLTSTGVSIGSPAYMAPEQAVADPTVDHRADLYALGVVAFEMVAGRTPFTGPNLAAIVAASLTQPAPPLTSVVPKCPPRLSALVSQLLEKDASKRPENAAIVRDTLRSIVADPSASSPTVSLPPRKRGMMLGVAAVFALFVVALLLRTGRGAARTEPTGAAANATPHSIAVLPFENLSHDSATDYFSDGMTEELISALGRLRGLRVASRTSTFAMKGHVASLADVGQRLGVDAVVEASVQRVADRVRVIARLVDIKHDSALWNGEYTSQLRDVLFVQDSLSRAIVSALDAVLGANASAALARPRSADPAAYDSYVRGRVLLGQRNPVAMAAAIQAFQAAIKLDSSFAPAYAGLADAYSLFAPFGGRPPKDVFPLARVAAQRALKLDSTLAEAHTSLGIVAMFYDWDWATAGTHLPRGVELNPSSAEGHLFYAWYLVFRGQMERALAEVTRAHELDKLSPVIATRHGNILGYFGRDAEAIVHLREALRLDSTFINAREELAYEYLITGQRDSARRVVPRDVVHTGTGEGAFPAMVLAQLGDSAGAREQLRRVEAAARQRYVASDVIAGIYAALGDSTRALDFLERAADERAFTMVFLAHYPMFEPLHGNARFRRLVQRVGVIQR